MKMAAIGLLLLLSCGVSQVGCSARIALAGSEPSEVGGYNVERLATAIYHAEGGSKTAWPYGILARYKHTTPRQACINTVRHKARDWEAQGAKGDYLEYLQSKYCPTKGNKLTNDEKRLNIYWLKNIRSIYGQEQGRSV